MLRRNQTNNQLASLLNTRVKICYNGRTSVKNALGQYDIVEKVLDDVWACMVPQTGGLLSGRTAETTLSRTTHKIIIRYRNDITSDMWINHKNQRYDILYILDPYNNHERLELFCEVKL